MFQNSTIKPKNQWEPNTSSDHCKVCNIAIKKSSLFKSNKHHCRYCGMIVCSLCSCNSRDNNRICDICYSMPYSTINYKKSRLSTSSLNGSNYYNYQHIDIYDDNISILSKNKWIKQLRINKCFTCKLKLRLSNNKHHCRYCGNIFCCKCSPYQKHNNINVRTCYNCHDILKQTEWIMKCKQTYWINNGSVATFDELLMMGFVRNLCYSCNIDLPPYDILHLLQLWCGYHNDSWDTSSDEYDDDNPFKYNKSIIISSGNQHVEHITHNCNEIYGTEIINFDSNSDSNSESKTWIFQITKMEKHRPYIIIGIVDADYTYFNYGKYKGYGINIGCDNCKQCVNCKRIFTQIDQFQQGSKAVLSIIEMKLNLKLKTLKCTVIEPDFICTTKFTMTGIDNTKNYKLSVTMHKRDAITLLEKKYR